MKSFENKSFGIIKFPCFLYSLNEIHFQIFNETQIFSVVVQVFRCISRSCATRCTSKSRIKCRPLRMRPTRCDLMFNRLSNIHRGTANTFICFAVGIADNFSKLNKLRKRNKEINLFLYFNTYIISKKLCLLIQQC